MIDLSIILVNYNTALMTMNCIKSIFDQNMPIQFEIIVVDNASNDKSKDILTKQFPSIKWIQNDINEGFGRANNIGISKALGKYILLLNTDTIIIDNAIERALIKYKSENDQIGLITCQLLNSDNSKQTSFFTENASFTELLKYNLLIEYLCRRYLNSRKKEIKALHGAFILFNKNQLKDIGYFDPDFFMYAEEFELCHRVLKKGLKLKFYDTINIYHLEEGSSISKEWNIKQRNLSGALLFKKTHGNIGLLIFLLINFVNLITNSILMWKLDKRYRSNFLTSQKYFWLLIGQYLKVLFGLYSRPLKYNLK